MGASQLAAVPVVWHKPGPMDEQTTSNGFWRRWGWVVVLQALLLGLLAADLVPWLRGYKPWPPEWRWRHELGANLWWLIPAGGFGALVVGIGWWADAATNRTGKLARVLLLCFAAVGWQATLAMSRTPDPTLSIYQRTTVFFLEDFFHAAARIDLPAQAFTSFDDIRENYNQNRIATHPPGIIFVYKSLIDLAPERGGDWLPAHPLVFAQDQWPVEGKLRAGLALAVAFKGMSVAFLLAGVWLIVAALRREDEPHVHGRIAAAVALVPAVALFTFTLDQVVAGLATLAVGGLLHAIAFRKMAGVILAGCAIFLQSLLAWQVSVTIFTAVVASLLLAFFDGRAAGLRSWSARAAVFLTIPTLLWFALWAATGYNWFGEFFRGVRAHTSMAIHNNRSRLAWLGWNVWDMVWFLGVAFVPLWLSRRTWRAERNPLMLSLVAVWVLAIVLADAVRGETARVLLPLFPLLGCALLVPNAEWLKRGEYWLVAGLLVIQSLTFGAVLNLF